jgi:7-cyano-7-deazaguanine synthase
MTQSSPASGALVLFSGGQDSTVCLAWALERFERVETVGFDYGQRHRIELECRPRILSEIRARFPKWADRLGGDRVLDLRSIAQASVNALTSETPFEQEEGELPNTFVPGRNLIFLGYAGAVAYGLGLSGLVGGMCETDYSGYPDCRRDTLDAMQAALSKGLDRPMSVETPLMWIDKAGTWTMAHQLGGEALVRLIVDETHTCYEGDRVHIHAWGAGCATCPACLLRAKGWDAYARGRRP